MTLCQSIFFHMVCMGIFTHLNLSIIILASVNAVRIRPAPGIVPRTMGFSVAAPTIVPAAISPTDPILHARSIFLKIFVCRLE